MHRKMPLSAAGSAASGRPPCTFLPLLEPQAARFDDLRAISQASKVGERVHRRLVWVPACPSLLRALDRFGVAGPIVARSMPDLGQLTVGVGRLG